MESRSSLFPWTIHAAYQLLSVCGWPWLLLYYRLRTATDGKYCGSYRQRLGLDLPDFPSGRSRIWFHALSVGEALSAFSLVRATKERFPDSDIVFSTATESGQDIARKRLHAWVSEFFFLPHDFPWSMQRLVRRLEPAFFVQVETDTWPNLLRALRGFGIPSFLVNARLSPTSYRRLRILRRALLPVLECFDLIFAQSLQDADYYEAVGFPKDRIQVAGNLKFDRPYAPLASHGIERLRRQTGISTARQVWVAGSTHPTEEAMLLRVHGRLLQAYPELLLVLAPRNVQRSLDLLALCHRFGMQAVRHSAAEGAEGKNVYVLDTIGELASLYALAEVAFIGGSLIPFGGHNPLEPLAQGKPVVWGPHFFNFREIEAMLLEAGCGRRVRDMEELTEILRAWLADRSTGVRAAAAARELFARHQGSTQRILTLIDARLTTTTKAFTMERRSFPEEEVAVLRQAIDIAEELISDHYKISTSQWKSYRYDIQSLKDLGEGEITDSAFAQIRRYAVCPNERLRGSEPGDFFKICLQDHVIARAVRRDSQINLLPLSVYIVTHELIHVVRFAKFLQRFDATEEERSAEEQRVHSLTAQLMIRCKVRGLAEVLEAFQGFGNMETFVAAPNA